MRKRLLFPLLLTFYFIACSSCFSAEKGNVKNSTSSSQKVDHSISKASSTSGSPVPLPEWAMGGFVRPKGINPVIVPDKNSTFFCPMSQKMIHWEAEDTFNPAAAVKGDQIILLYRAEDNFGKGIGRRTSRLGYASSTDGIRFKREAAPVLFPGGDDQSVHEVPGGCEDPRVAVTEDGLYVLLYTQWNRLCPRLAVAQSRDLKNWKKSGPAFEEAYGRKFYNFRSKSASIVTCIKNGKQVITKVNGKYWMYWGEQKVYAATSDNLTDWYPLLDEKGGLKVLFQPRPGFFDSELTECGPPAILTNKGILLLYNGKNLRGENRDKRFTPDVYSAGQALFDAKQPDKLLKRLDVPFFRPVEAFEQSGQYPAGTVFIEGMAFFKGKWYLYYGCADSRVGVAVFDPEKPAPADPMPEIK
ncbi:MAG: glycoside hydrolase family 130 protein [Bacteroidales bacterium]|nr:glycoside hydrolase family 130 protein [Bacteroidales bacterium]